jgi:hypothetical protein
VPANNRLRLDEEQGAAPPGKKSREQDKQTALVAAKGGAFDSTRCDDELLAQKRVLGDQLGARTGQIGGEATRDARGAACADSAHRERQDRSIVSAQIWVFTMRRSWRSRWPDPRVHDRAEPGGTRATT